MLIMMKRSLTLAALSLSFVKCSQAREDYPVPRTLRVSKNTAATSAIATSTVESDLELAQQFAPVILNEDRRFQRRDGTRMTYWDSVDTVLYDVAQTTTHVYISYQIMKSASMDIQVENAVNTTLAIIPGYVYIAAFVTKKNPVETYHPVDSEDILVVLQKKENNKLDIVLYATNLHGKRLVYPNRKLVEAVEQEKFDDMTAGFEYHKIYSSFLTTPGIQEILQMDRKEMATLAGRPFIASGAGSHALTAARIDLQSKLVTDRLKAGQLRISALEGINQLEGITTPITGYKLIAEKQLIEEMTFAPSLIAANKNQEEDKAASCNSFKLSLNGNEVQSPALPTHFDPRWYLGKFNPFLLKQIENSIAIDARKNKLLDIPQADFFYAHERSPDVEKNGLLDCQRLDPAASFESMYPLTFNRQGGSTDYTRYELLNTKAAAYAK